MLNSDESSTVRIFGTHYAWMSPKIANSIVWLVFPLTHTSLLIYICRLYNSGCCDLYHHVCKITVEKNAFEFSGVVEWIFLKSRLGFTAASTEASCLFYCVVYYYVFFMHLNFSVFIVQFFFSVLGNINLVGPLVVVLLCAVSAVFGLLSKKKNLLNLTRFKCDNSWWIAEETVSTDYTVFSCTECACKILFLSECLYTYY